MLVCFVLWLGSLSNDDRKVEYEEYVPVLPQIGYTIEHEGSFFQVTTVVLTAGKMPTVVGRISENPLTN